MLVFLLLAACGGGDAPSTDPSQPAPHTPTRSVLATTGQVSAHAPVAPTVTGKGFYLAARSGGFTAYYAFTIRNEDTENAYQTIPYQLTFFDADNKPLGGGSGYVSLLLPSATTAEASTSEFFGRATRFEVIVSEGRVSDTNGARTIPPTEATYQPARSNASAIVLGSISNPYDIDLQNVEAVAVLLDAGGHVIGGRGAFVTLLPASATMPVAIDTLSSHPMPAKVVVYTSPSTLTLLDLTKRSPWSRIYRVASRRRRFRVGVVVGSWRSDIEPALFCSQKWEVHSDPLRRGR